MGLEAGLQKEVKEILAARWDSEKARDVPDLEDLRLNANHAKELEATVAYADIDGSTALVDSESWTLAAEVYKAYLRCASAILKDDGGTIAAYDGDRVMAVFYGDSKNTSAVRAALKINRAVTEIINPAIKAQYQQSSFQLKHVVGIDTSLLHVAKVGVHSDNDLVWVGRAANHAAKLAAFSGQPTWITKSVYDNMNEQTRYANGVNMWSARSWGSLTVYCSNYRWGYI